MSSNKLLTIDIGNSYSKCSLIVGHESYFFDIKQLQSKVNDHQLNSKNTSTYISNVTDQEVNIDLDFINLKDHFNGSNFFTMPVKYNQTLGIDRIIAAYYVFKKFKSACIIDSGTFTTVDFVSQKLYAFFKGRDGPSSKLSGLHKFRSYYGFYSSNK